MGKIPVKIKLRECKKEGSSQTIQNKKVRDHLMRGINDRCCWCDKEIFKPISGQSIPNHNTATVDHIYSRLDIRRNIVKEAQNVVIACYECNNKREKAEAATRNQYRPTDSPYLIGMLFTPPVTV